MVIGSVHHRHAPRAEEYGKISQFTDTAGPSRIELLRGVFNCQ